MIHGVVAMDETVSRTGDIALRYFGMFQLKGIRNTAGGFADNLNELYERQREESI